MQVQGNGKDKPESTFSVEFPQHGESPLPLRQQQEQLPAAAPTPTEPWSINRDILLLVATLTYPIGSNPPGGFWQDDLKDGEQKGHVAGKPILRDKDPKSHWTLISCNWISFYSSLCLTVLLLSGQPTKSKWVKYTFLFSYTCLVLSFNMMQGLPFIVGLIIWTLFFFFFTAPLIDK